MHTLLFAGQTLLVLGAAGGVGLAAVQLGKVMGARVVAVARGAPKMRALRAAGADEVIDLSTIKTEQLRDHVRQAASQGELGEREGGGRGGGYKEEGCISN